MTRPPIDEIEARAQAASERPCCQRYDGNEAQERADSEFIAHARQDIPALIAYVRELEAELMPHRLNEMARQSEMEEFQKLRRGEP